MPNPISRLFHRGRTTVPKAREPEPEPQPAPRDLDALLVDLRSPDRGRRAVAAEELGRRGDPRAVGPLVEALGSPECEVRRAAAEALSQIADPRALGSIVSAAAAEKEDQVRSQLVRAVAAMADRDVPGAQEALARLEGAVPGG